MWRILACKNCGSAIAEAMLTLAGIPYEREEQNYSKPEAREVLLRYNPLAQVPTVILPDGEVMTETAAIALSLDERVPAAKLLPPVGDPHRPEAQRWLVFLVAAVYPTFTYGDEPEKWGCGKELRDSTNAHREKLWRYLEGVARGPWFLGEQRSVLDLYISVMSRWRPDRAWFTEYAPKLAAIANEVDHDARLEHVWRLNFG